MWNAIKSNYEHSHCVICNDTTIAWPCLLCKYLFLKRCIHLLAICSIYYYVMYDVSYLLCIRTILHPSCCSNNATQVDCQRFCVFLTRTWNNCSNSINRKKIIKRQRLIRIVVLYADCFSSVALYTIPGFDFTHNT